MITEDDVKKHLRNAFMDYIESTGRIVFVSNQNQYINEFDAFLAGYYLCSKDVKEKLGLK